MAFLISFFLLPFIISPHFVVIYWFNDGMGEEKWEEVELKLYYYN